MSPVAIALIVTAWLASIVFVVALCRVAGQSDIALNAKEPPMPYPPVRHDPSPTPVLDAGLALIVALIIVLVAASAHRIGWMVAGGAAAILALLVIAYYEER